MAKRLLLAFGLLVIVPAVSLADSVGLGLISFDVHVTGSQNVFNISNWTSDPSFDVFDPLVFQNSFLILVTLSGSQTIQLGAIGPGGIDPAPFNLIFLDSEQFLSATFTATLSQLTFQLTNGTFFSAASADLSAELLPTSGGTLTAGVDFAVLSVSGQVSSVPEPSTVVLLGAGLVALAGFKTRSSRDTRPPCTGD